MGNNGCPRYIGRGHVFHRLESRQKARPLELQYFSFYLVSEKKNEREIETLLIRTSSFLLEFNEKKKRVGISHGNVRDYEAGTLFYERHYKKGKKAYQDDEPGAAAAADACCSGSLASLGAGYRQAVMRIHCRVRAW